MMKTRKHLVWTLALALGAAGCGGGGDEFDEFGDLNFKDGGGGSTSASSSAPAGTASLAGKAVLEGAAPRAAKIRMDADAVCKAQHSTTVESEEVIADAKGNLKNVFVYVKEGAPKVRAPKTPVLLDQMGCMYAPHVAGVQAGQPLAIQNSDATLHNVHAMPTINDGFNIGQPSKGMKSEKVFAKPEVMVKFKCDVHSWMNCYVGVVDHPYFAVTAADGTFKIEGLPAGSYTLVAWQEKYGESAAQKVELKDGEAKSVNFTFAAK
jgi:plastocyanin